MTEIQVHYYPGGSIAPRPGGEVEGVPYGDAVEITLRGKRWPVPCAAVVALLDAVEKDPAFFAWIKDHSVTGAVVQTGP